MALDDGRAIPEFAVAALKNKPIRIQGDGSQTRSFCYVDDLVEGLIHVGLDTKAGGEIFNVGNPREVTILQAAELIREIANSTSPIEFVGAVADDPQRRCPDIAKIQKAYGWAPSVSLEDGLAAVLEDVRQRLAVDSSPNLR